MPSRPPSVDALARSISDVGLPHPLLVAAARSAIAAGRPDDARKEAETIARTLLRPVINATGVLLHTNLGRAPLPGRTAGDQPVRSSNLEIDLSTGRRGSRSHHAAALLARACGAEAALVVNNGAAALLLVLATLAAGRRVLVSRGELVEVGGGFRIPDILATSGAQLVEVGTTNRTRLADYRRELNEETALVLEVHQSNFRIVGFAEQVSVADLATLGPPVVHDIGSGLLDAATPWLPGGPPAWLAGEPAARQSLGAGASLVTFSGDKLLGGPQAGIIAGDAELVGRCAAHPLARALRPGSLVLATLQETALAYLRRDLDGLPFWRMATTPVEEMRERAVAVAARVSTLLGDCSATAPDGHRRGAVVEVVSCEAVAGGGSLPGREIPSAGVAVSGDHTRAMRALDPPVVARVEEGRTVCDLRTVDRRDDQLLAEALAAAIAAD